MAIVNKNFKVKNGINVAGTATISGAATFESDVNVGSLNLNSTPIQFDQTTKTLQIYIDNAWQPIAFKSQIDSNAISFMDVGLAIDYNGQPIYTIYANGVITTATKFADGANPATETFALTFDSGTI